MTDTQTSRSQAAARRNTVLATIAVALFMGGLSFAAVPLYDWICRVTGFAGTTQRADGASDVVIDREITVRFDANISAGMPWTFEPLQTEMRVRIGETALAFYRAHNPTSEPVTGSATFNVAPFDVGSYFSKIDCFCFTEQTLQPGESVDMPVSFYVDPALVEDKENSEIQVITLSYTFFRQEAETAAANATTEVDHSSSGG